MSKVEDSKIWKLGIEIAEDAYKALEELPEEEKWGLASKLRGRGADAMTAIAEALGSIDPRDKKWQLGKARASLFAVKSMYQLAHKTNMLEIIPENMVKIDTALSEIDKLVGVATLNIPKWFDEMDSPARNKKK